MLDDFQEIVFQDFLQIVIFYRWILSTYNLSVAWVDEGHSNNYEQIKWKPHSPLKVISELLYLRKKVSKLSQRTIINCRRCWVVPSAHNEACKK